MGQLQPFYAKAVHSVFYLLVLTHLVTQILQAHAPLIQVYPASLQFSATPGANPLSQNLALTNGTHGRMPWRATVSTANGSNWLQVAPAEGVLPGLVEGESTNLKVTPQVANYPNGLYRATIRFSAPGDDVSSPASNTPLSLEVEIVISTSTGAVLRLSHLSAQLSGIAGLRQNASTAITIGTPDANRMLWAASVATDNGLNWLSVDRSSGITPGQLNILASAAEIQSGVHSGRVRITSEGALNSPDDIRVTFSVRDPIPALVKVDNKQFSFTGRVDTPNPAPATLRISNGGETDLNWTLAFSTFNGGRWLSVSPLSGNGPADVKIFVDASALDAGIYAGSLSISAPGAVNPTTQIPISLRVSRPIVTISSNGVANAATLRSIGIVPGEIVSIVGSHLGPAEGISASIDMETGKLPSALGGTRVTVNNVPAPIFYASATLVNFQVPYQIGGSTGARLTVEAAGVDPAELSLRVVAGDPGVFAYPNRHAAALNQDGTVNSPANPATRGSVLQLYATGQGILDIPIETGAPAPSEPPFPAPLGVVTFDVGFQPAKIVFAGMAPGLIGVVQVNVQIPLQIDPKDDVQLILGLSGAPAAPVLISVK